MSDRDKLLSLIKDVILYIKGNTLPCDSVKVKLKSRIEEIDRLFKDLSREDILYLDKEYRLWYNDNVEGIIDPKLKEQLNMLKGW